MTDLVYDYISTGVDMIITAAILSAIVVLLRSSVILSGYQARMQSNSDRMNYYKQYNMYDNTDGLCTADVISALTYYRYDLQIVIVDGTSSPENVLYHNDPNSGKFYRGTGTGTEVSLDDIQSTLRANWSFHGYLVEDLKSTPNTYNYEGGVVTGLKFTRTH